LPKSRKRKTKKGGATYRSTYSPGKKSNRNAVIIAIAVIGVLALAGVVFLATGGGGGLKIEDLTVGTGPSPQPGQNAVVLYTGTLENGTVFDKSTDRARPYSFVFGTGSVIKGWDKGLEGMKVGGKRRLTIPPDLAYGEKGFSSRVPPNATLIFEIELLGVK
jgi:FKBP-type peptidyl-prolyl cis-trans isomerase